MNYVSKLRRIIYLLCLENWLITSVTERNEGVLASEAFYPEVMMMNQEFDQAVVSSEFHCQIMLIEPTEASLMAFSGFPVP